MYPSFESSFHHQGTPQDSDFITRKEFNQYIKRDLRRRNDLTKHMYGRVDDFADRLHSLEDLNLQHTTQRRKEEQSKESMVQYLASLEPYYQKTIQLELDNYVPKNLYLRNIGNLRDALAQRTKELAALQTIVEEQRHELSQYQFKWQREHKIWGKQQDIFRRGVVERIGSIKSRVMQTATELSEGLHGLGRVVGNMHEEYQERARSKRSSGINQAETLADELRRLRQDRPTHSFYVTSESSKDEVVFDLPTLSRSEAIKHLQKGLTVLVGWGNERDSTSKVQLTPTGTRLAIGNNT